MTSLLSIISLNIAAYVLLMTSLLLFWTNVSRATVGTIIAASFLAAFVANVVELEGLFVLFILGIFIYLFYQENSSKNIRIISFLSVVCLGLMLFMHSIPGFNNWKIYPQITLGHSSPSFPIWLNFDKTLIAILLLLFAYKPRIDLKKCKEIIAQSLLYFVPLAFLMFIVAMSMEYIVLDIKYPDAHITLIWLAKMLFFVAVVEELFFRFFIQRNIVQFLKKYNNGKIIGLAISSLFFSICHVSAGINFMILAFISGMFYGAAYLKTRRIEVAILLHFFLNSSHFFFFSYPYYKGVVK